MGTTHLRGHFQVSEHPSLLQLSQQLQQVPPRLPPPRPHQYIRVLPDGSQSLPLCEDGFLLPVIHLLLYSMLFQFLLDLLLTIFPEGHECLHFPQTSNLLCLLISESVSEPIERDLLERDLLLKGRGQDGERFGESASEIEVNCLGVEEDVVQTIDFSLLVSQIYHRLQEDVGLLSHSQFKSSIINPLIRPVQMEREPDQVATAESLREVLQKAAQMVKESEVIIVGTGAGMGKDSGLPDFRGDEGFWNNYPPYRGKFNFVECANPAFLQEHPHLFWGFYGHRLSMYRNASPHYGYQLLKKMATSQSSESDNIFAFTSNVDGHFQKAKYPDNRIYEVHGSIHFLQCYSCQTIVDNKFEPIVDLDKMSCSNLPLCSKCEDTLRPNILMFDDWEWVVQRAQPQECNYKQFLKSHSQKNKVLIEIGCGQAIPTIRDMMEQLLDSNKNSVLIRINPDLSTSYSSDRYGQRYVHIPLPALEALQNITELL